MSDRPTCFIDTETTSLLRDRMPWEVCIIRREVDGRESRSVLHLPIDETKADPKALDVGGYFERSKCQSMRDWLVWSSGHGPVPGQVMEIFELTHGATIVGAVPSFDTEALSNALAAFGMVGAWHHRLICVESLVAGHLGRTVGGLRDCALAMGLDIDDWDQHTAEGDAVMTMQVYDAVMGAIPPDRQRLTEALGERDRARDAVVSLWDSLARAEEVARAYVGAPVAVETPSPVPGEGKARVRAAARLLGLLGGHR